MRMLFAMAAHLFLGTPQLEQKNSASAALCWHVARNRAAFLSHRKRRLAAMSLKGLAL
jgi:hypothetical protein